MARHSRHANFRIAVKLEDEPRFYTTVRAFARDNRGDPGVVRLVRRLQPGQRFCGGGGAGTAFCVSRPKRQRRR